MPARNADIGGEYFEETHRYLKGAKALKYSDEYILRF